MAEDLLANFQYSRQQQRYSSLSGVTPTIPVLTGATMTAYTEADNMVLGNFTDTDILDSEIFLNTSDDRVFIRSNDSILEFLMAGSSGSTYNSGNGITVGTGNTINLGGTLNQPTIISGNSQTFDLGVTGSELSFLRIKSIQAQEDYKFSGEGLEVIQNPGTFRTEFDYTSSLGDKTQIWQTPSSVYTLASSNSGTTTSQIIQTPGIINIVTNTDNTTLSESGLILDQPSDSFRFVDNRLAHRGLEYDADYSSGYTSLSLITKGDLDTAISAITDNNYYTTGTTLIGNTIYFDRNDTLSAYTADLSSITFSGGSGNCISDLYVTNVHGCSPITIKDELIIESGITGTGNIDITGNVISDVVQLRGGVGTQGEMSWSTDEETVQLVMDGTTLHIGQDTFVHARNNTASIITKGTAVYATGTLGASGRITVAPMIANGTIPGRLFIGLAAENIAIGADGQVMTFGKIRQINTNSYNDGDVLWLSPTVAGQLTATEPTAPNLKIATAFVIHAATNGTLMVRAEQGNDLHSDQRVQVSGLANNDVLTWNNSNQRWQNAQPTINNIYTTNGTIGSGRVATLTDTLSINNSSNVTNLQFKNKSVGIKGDNLLVTPGDVVDQALNLKYQTSTNTGVIIPIGTSGSGKGNLNLQANRTTIENIWTNDDVKINGNSTSIGAVRTIEIPFYDGSWKGINLRTIQENGGGARLEIQTSPGGLGGTYQNALVINKNTNIDITGRVTMSTTTDGILMPRLTTAQMNAIVSPTTNVLIYNTDLNALYRYNGSSWVALSAGYGIIGVYSGSGNGTPTFFADLQSALETCKASGGYFTVKLYSNITITSAIEIDYTNTGVGNAYLFRQLTIDFNGFSVTNAQANTSNAFTIELSNSASVYQEIRFINGTVLRTNGTGTHHALQCDTINRFGTIQMSNMLWYCQNNQAARINLGLSTAVDANTVMDLGGSKFISGGTGRTCTFNNAAQTITNFSVRSTSSLDAFYPDGGRYYNFYAENTSSGAAILAVGSNAILTNFNCRSNSGKALDLNGTGMEAHNFTAKSTSGIAVDVKGAATATLFKCDTGNAVALNIEGNSTVKHAYAQNNSGSVGAVATNDANIVEDVTGVNLGASFGGRLQNTTALRGSYNKCTFRSIGGIGAEVISTTNTIDLDTCNFESQLDTSGGHALRVQSVTAGTFILTKCDFKVRNAGANCLNAAAATTVRSRYSTHNDVATTPINANVTIVSSGIIS